MGNQPVSPIIPVQLTTDMVMEAHPQAAIGVKHSAQHPAQVSQVLIQWFDLPLCDATWEDAQAIQLRFPGSIAKAQLNPPIFDILIVEKGRKLSSISESTYC